MTGPSYGKEPQMVKIRNEESLIDIFHPLAYNIFFKASKKIDI